MTLTWVQRLVLFAAILTASTSSGQTCLASITAQNPTSVYQVQGGTAVDTRTGLVWDQCTWGRSGPICSEGLSASLTWLQAIQLPGSINLQGYKGYSDWRLPSVKELKSLVEECRTNPSINDAVFPSTESALFWSSTPVSYANTHSWGVSFGNGFVGPTVRTYNDTNQNTVNLGRVRLVRGGSVQYTPPVNGACGTAHGVATVLPPTANLCNAGQAGSVNTDASSYRWTCAGLNGGTSASCAAPIAPPPVITLSLPRSPMSTATVAHGDAHTGARMDDGTSPGHELRTTETLRIDCSSTCMWNATVEPASAANWLKFATPPSGVVEAGGASALSFSIDPFNETVNTRTGTIRVSAVGGSSSTWVVTQNPLSDWDEDGVPDEWEQRGAPAADGTRIALSGGYFGSNGIFNPVTSPPYGRIYPGSVAPANPAYEYRDLWVWIDEMVLSSNLTLNDVALKAISKSFDRHSIRVIWRRAPRESGMTLLSPKTLDFGNGTESEMIAVARDFVESAKSTNFLKAAALSSLDKIYRYVIWGVNIASADPSSCPDGVSFHNHGINGIYLGANGCATPDGLDRFGTLRKDADQAATLMHELGHSLGLNHGGPQFKSAADAAAGRLWNGANYPLEADYDSEQNRKPNHTSIMNYNFSNYAGVVARNPEYSLDYQNINFDTIDEQNLFQFWRTPVASGGNSNDDFGTIFHCNGEKRISRPGDKNIKCAPDTILFTQRPMSTDLTNDTHQTRNKLVSHTEWDRLIFPMTWLNVEGASALSLRDREPGVQFGKQLPRDYDVSISTPLLGVLKVLRGGQATLNIRLTNEGSQTDQYALAPQDLGSLGLAGVVALTVPSATELKGSESRTLPLQISVASNAPVGTYETYVVAKSDNNPIGASVLLRIEVVTDPNLVSSIPTDTTSQSVDEFSFIDVSGAELSTYYETTPVVITGLNVPIPVLVRDGQVSINSAPWTQYIATVRPGDTLRLRVLSSQYGGDTRRAEVLLGGLLRRFSVTTSTTCNLDIDGDNVVSPSTDGVLLSRFLLGYRDSALTNGLTLSGSRVTPQVIADFIGSAAQYEVFGRVAAPIATVDGLVLTRLMLGLPDSSILNGVDVPSDAEFARPAEIRSFVNKKCGVNFASP